MAKSNRRRGPPVQTTCGGLLETISVARNSSPMPGVPVSCIVADTLGGQRSLHPRDRESVVKATHRKPRFACLPPSIEPHQSTRSKVNLAFPPRHSDLQCTVPGQGRPCTSNGEPLLCRIRDHWLTRVMRQFIRRDRDCCMHIADHHLFPGLVSPADGLLRIWVR